jgi:hypothetical protein
MTIELQVVKNDPQFATPQKSKEKAMNQEPSQLSAYILICPNHA